MTGPADQPIPNTDVYRYFRRLLTLGRDEPMSRDEWLAVAHDNVRDVGVALEHGFRTANADYWTEPAR